MPNGPRIIMKADRDSSIGRGCVIYRGMLRPESICMVAAAAETAPVGMDDMNVSEGWRGSRRTRDLHAEQRAWDISARGVPAQDDDHLQVLMNEWAERIQTKLGDAYTVFVHDTGSGLHIHIELDP